MPKTANKLPAMPFPWHLDVFTSCYELAAIQPASCRHARGSCFMYTWYVWLFQHPMSFICHWERPVWAAEVAPLYIGCGQSTWMDLVQGKWLCALYGWLKSHDPGLCHESGRMGPPEKTQSAGAVAEGARPHMSHKQGSLCNLGWWGSPDGTDLSCCWPGRHEHSGACHGRTAG